MKRKGLQLTFFAIFLINCMNPAKGIDTDYWNKKCDEMEVQLHYGGSKLFGAFYSFYSSIIALGVMTSMYERVAQFNPKIVQFLSKESISSDKIDSFFEPLYTMRYGNEGLLFSPTTSYTVGRQFPLVGGVAAVLMGLAAYKLLTLKKEEIETMQKLKKECPKK